MESDTFASEIMAHIQYTFEAHCVHPRVSGNTTRMWDHSTPYIIHPLWCAMTILFETRLPADVRRIGYQALMLHDIPEDSTLGLSGDISPDVIALVNELCFESFAEECRDIWNRSSLAKLLKLYDKTSNLLDGEWMNNDLWRSYVDHTAKLTAFVRTTYGDLNIVRFADAVCERRDDRVEKSVQVSRRRAED